MRRECLTTHGNQRLQERIAKSNSQMNRNLLQAFRCGKLYTDLPKCRLREYIKNKACAKHNKKTHIEIRYFNGYLWLKNSKTNRLVTLYTVPEGIMRDYTKKINKRHKPQINIEDRDDYWIYE